MQCDNLTFVHLSDLHITPAPRDHFLGIDTAAALRRVMATVRAMDIGPAFFVVSGDLVNAPPTAAAYDHLRQLLDAELMPFGVPVLLGLGNHDSRVLFREQVLGEPGGDEATPCFYARTVQGLRILMLDSLMPGRSYGRLSTDQLAWIREILREPALAGTLLVLHDPVVYRGVPRDAEHAFVLENAAELRAVLAGHEAELLGILTGHQHSLGVACFAGVLTVANPGTAFFLDPSVRKGNRFLAGSAFNLCSVRAGTLIVNPVVLPGDQREVHRRL